MVGLKEELFKAQRDQVAPCGRQLVLPATPGAEALAAAVRTRPERITLYFVQVHVEEVLQAKTAEHLVARYRQLLFEHTPPLLVRNDLFQNQCVLGVFGVEVEVVDFDFIDVNGNRVEDLAALVAAGAGVAALGVHDVAFDLLAVVTIVQVVYVVPVALDAGWELHLRAHLVGPALALLEELMSLKRELVARACPT